MNETNKPEVLQRLDRLERENRRWKVLGCTAFAVLGLIVLVGATGSKGTKVAEEIRARKFVLVDKAGKVRGILGESGNQPKPSFGLFIYGRDGKDRIELSQFGDGAKLSLFHGSLPAGAHLNVISSGGVVLAELELSARRILSDYGGSGVSLSANAIKGGATSSRITIG